MRPLQQGSKLPSPWHFFHASEHVPIGDCDVVLGRLVAGAGFIVVSVLADLVVDAAPCWHVQGPPDMHGQTPAGTTAHAAVQAASVAPYFSAPSVLSQVRLLPVVELLADLLDEGIGVVEMASAVVDIGVVCTWVIVTAVVVCAVVVAASVV